MLQQILYPCTSLWGEDEVDDPPAQSKKGKTGKRGGKTNQKISQVPLQINVNVNHGRSAKREAVKVKYNEEGEVEISNGRDTQTRGHVLSKNDKKPSMEKVKKRQKKSRSFKFWWNDDDSDSEEEEYEDDDDDEDDDKDDDDDNLPHEKPLVRTWLRLLLVSFFAVFVTGLLPGQALFIRMLSDYGLYKSVCEEGEQMCAKQEVAVTAAFSIIEGISMFSNLPSGYLFDRLGGRRSSCIGAACTFVGVLLMEIPILGVKYGYDNLTSKVFPVAICFTDVGSCFSQYCVLSLVYHFPNSQLLVIALLISQQQVCAILPNVFLYVQQVFQLDLSEIFALFSLLTLSALVGLALAVPSQKEYLKQAKRVMGSAMPSRSKGLWSDMKACCRVMRAYWLDHVYFCVAFTCFVTHSVMYTSFVGEYIELLWGSQKAGDDFAALLTIVQSTLGTSSAIVVSIVADRAGAGALYVVAASGVSLLACSALNILGAAYFQQLTCMLSNIALPSFSALLSMKYSVAYAPPSQLGTFNGAIWTICTFLYTTELTFFLGLAANAATAAALGNILLTVNVIATVAFMIWATRQFVKGFPRKPPLICESEEDLSLTQAFL